MATTEAGIMYDQIVKGTIIRTKVDRGVYVLNTKPCTNVLIKYIIITSINYFKT